MAENRPHCQNEVNQWKSINSVFCFHSLAHMNHETYSYFITGHRLIVFLCVATWMYSDLCMARLHVFVFLVGPGVWWQLEETTDIVHLLLRSALWFLLFRTALWQVTDKKLNVRVLEINLYDCLQIYLILQRKRKKNIHACMWWTWSNHC